MKIRRSSGLKGQQAGSPGQRPGWMASAATALKGQKHYFCGRSATIGDAFVAKRRNNAFALSGRWLRLPFTQGGALGYLLAGLSGRCCASLCELAKLELSYNKL